MELRASLKTNPTVWHWNGYQRMKDSLFPPPRGAATVSPQLYKMADAKCLKYRRGWIKKNKQKNQRCKYIWMYIIHCQREQRWKEESSREQLHTGWLLKPSLSPTLQTPFTKMNTQANRCTCMLLLNLSYFYLLLCYFITLPKSWLLCWVMVLLVQWQKKSLRFTFFRSCWGLDTWYHSHIKL